MPPFLGETRMSPPHMWKLLTLTLTLTLALMLVLPRPT